MPENRDNNDPDPGKGFTRSKLAQLQEIKKSQLDTALQNKVHTDTLDQLLFHKKRICCLMHRFVIGLSVKILLKDYVGQLVFLKC